MSVDVLKKGKIMELLIFVSNISNITILVRTFFFFITLF